MSATWRILEGDAADVLRGLPERSVHTVVTSPPYYNLRDYSVPGQIGLEATPELYVAALVAVFREVRRVLRDDGTVWLVIGDSHAGSWGAQSRGGEPDAGSLSSVQIAAHPKGQTRTGSIPDGADYKPKDLLGIPWLVAFALRTDGWWLRSDIIWSKANPMPESVADRPTRAHEYVFLLSKRATYHYDADAIREDVTPEGIAREGRARLTPAHSPPGTQPNRRESSNGAWLTSGRNKRSVWTVATQPYAGAHFATFPPKLIEPCILAGAPERACGECGAPWTRIVEGGESTYGQRKALGYDKPANMRPGEFGGHHNGIHPPGMSHDVTPAPKRTVGWEPSCEHGDGSAAGVVLDPFAGAGTTGVVALRHGRSFLGIELNADYAEMGRERIRDDAPLFNYLGEAA